MIQRRRSIYQQILAFFTLNPDNLGEYRKILFLQIHDICFWGQGGYDFDTVYNFPIWLRKFVLSQLKEHYEKSKPNDETNIQTTIKNLKNLKNQQPYPPPNPKQKILYQSGASKK